MKPAWRDPAKALVLNLLLAVVCGLSARAAQLLFEAINEKGILFWPPVGLALGAVLLGGPRLLWGAFLGLFLNGILYGITPWLSFTIAAGDAVEVMLAYTILARDPGFNRSFIRSRDYLFLFAIAALTAAIGTTIGMGSVVVSGRIPWEMAPQIWVRWWMGDQLGILLIVPAFLVWWHKPRHWLRPERRLEFVCFLGLAFLAGQALFMGWVPASFAPFAKGYLAFLYVTWAAVRYGRHGVTLLLLMVLAQALSGAAAGVGYFAMDNARSHLTNFWFYMVTLTVVGMALASVILERGQAEEAAQQEASFKDQVLAAVPGGLLVFGPDGRIVFSNARAEAMLGRSGPDLLGQPEAPLWHLLHQDLTPLEPGAYPATQVLATGNPTWNEELGLTQPGEAPPLWMLVNAFPELRADGTLGKVVVMFLDITDRKAEEQERRRLEAILQHSQKMESLGTLAGGIAHDMNNVLGGIMMVASTLKEIRAEDQELAGPLDTLLAASERGRDLVKNLLGFTRQSLDQPQPVDLNELIRMEMDILRHTTRHKVELVGDLTPDYPLILGEPSALGAAIMNLSVNALDAMEGGGTLSFTTRILPNGDVQLLVADTGCGMDPELLKRAFDPFFTTKPVGKGTGLGLSLLHATLKAHRATVEVQSEVGKGTRFTLRFPPLSLDHPHPKGVPEPPPDSAPAPTESGSRGLVLLVDDEPMIREVTPPLLQALGFRTEALDRGEACLSRLQTTPVPDLLILDHNMPGLTGMETLRRLRAEGNTLPVILASGFLDPEQETELRRTPFVWILRKPYALRELKPLLAEILGPAAQG